MAFRSTSCLNSTWSRLRSHAVAAVPPLNHPRAYATSATEANAGRAEPRKGKPVGQFVPVYAAAGMIALALCIGLHTAKQQLMHAPAVRVKKSKRETVPEVVEPEHVEEESEKFLNRSFFRKVAHVQDFDTSRSPVPDSIRKDVYAHPPKAETLRSVGVDPAPKQA